jgi:hypothetical protein
MRNRLKNPPYGPREFLDMLQRQGLPEAVSKLSGFVTLL